MEVYAVKALNIENSLFDRLMSCLSYEKQSKIKRFLRREDAERGLVADILARSIVSRKLGIDNSDIVFKSNEFGKPALQGHPNFHFNLTHSGCWVACAVDDAPIGVDVEMVQPIDFDIAKNYFFSEEYADFLNKPENEKLSFFFDLWTLKESYMKAAGKGFSIPLRAFCIKAGNEGIKLLETKDTFKDCFFKQYDIDSGYKMAVCASNENFPETVIIKTIQDIYEDLAGNGS